MRVSATDLKANLGKYIELAAMEDIIIMKNGKEVALLTNLEGKKTDNLKSLRGIIKGSDFTRDEIRAERLGKYIENSH